MLNFKEKKDVSELTTAQLHQHFVFWFDKDKSANRFFHTNNFTEAENFLQRSLDCDVPKILVSKK